MTFGEADSNSFMHGVSSDEATTFRVLDRALERGVNFVDTADVYGQDGLSERTLGGWFERSGRRDDVVLATKFRFRMKEGPNGTGAARLRIVRCCEDSLRRLRTDRLDLYQIHMQDLTVPEEEILRALDDLVRAGKVLYLGCSNYAAWRLMQSLWTSDVRDLERFVGMQVQYSLLERGIERELVPVAREYGLGILPWSPLAGGFLTGKYRRGQPPPEGTRLEKWRDRYAQFDDDRSWRVLDAVLAVAEEVGASPAAVSLAWLLHQPQVTSVIFGARTPEQLDANVEAADLALTPEQVKRLDEAGALDVGYPYSFIRNIQGRW
jgi:aryl-alcohol dehydrogenase-like predicted oxidoreductase